MMCTVEQQAASVACIYIGLRNRFDQGALGCQGVSSSAGWRRPRWPRAHSTGKTAKIAEHGGADPEDRDVPLTVYAPSAVAPNVVSQPVQTTQIAPTILRLLGLDPQSLDAVRIEGTRVLPGL
jgi:arylsulfatase A-like enzyme